MATGARGWGHCAGCAMRASPPLAFNRVAGALVAAVAFRRLLCDPCYSNPCYSCRRRRCRRRCRRGRRAGERLLARPLSHRGPSLLPFAKRFPPGGRTGGRTFHFERPRPKPPSLTTANFGSDRKLRRVPPVRLRGAGRDPGTRRLPRAPCAEPFLRSPLAPPAGPGLRGVWRCRAGRPDIGVEALGDLEQLVHD